MLPRDGSPASPGQKEERTRSGATYCAIIILGLATPALYRRPPQREQTQVEELLGGPHGRLGGERVCRFIFPSKRTRCLSVGTRKIGARNLGTGGNALRQEMKHCLRAVEKVESLCSPAIYLYIVRWGHIATRLIMEFRQQILGKARRRVVAEANDNVHIIYNPCTARM